MRLFIIRHGERADEVCGERDASPNVNDSTTSKFTFADPTSSIDPVLTAVGITQAQTAFASLLQHISNQSNNGTSSPTPPSIFTSPLRRCTTSALQSLHPKIEIVRALCNCAAAVNKCGGHKNLPHEVIGDLPLRANDWNHTTNVFHESKESIPLNNFFEALKYCITSTPPSSSAIVVVSHREGIRELCNLLGYTVKRMPYCCVLEVEVDNKRFFDGAKIIGFLNDDSTPLTRNKFDADEDFWLCRRMQQATIAPSPTPPTQKSIIIDCGYPWPREKKPRRERINAVAKQLHNFLLSRPSHHATDIKFIIAGDDLQPLINRMKETNSTIESLVTFQSALPHPSDAVYLSPESPNTFALAQSAPTTLIIGGIIDRNPTPGRSLKRADELNIKTGCFPLERCDLDEISNREPLNVDTVCAICERWMGGETLKNSVFESLCSHEERHPNRRLHL